MTYNALLKYYKPTYTKPTGGWSINGSIPLDSSLIMAYPSSTSNYVQGCNKATDRGTYLVIKPSTAQWVTKFRLKGTPTNNQVIISPIVMTQHCSIYAQITATKYIRFYLYDNNSYSSDYILSSSTINLNTWYWIKIVYDGSVVTFWLSTDGTNYTQQYYTGYGVQSITPTHDFWGGLKLGGYTKNANVDYDLNETRVIATNNLAADSSLYDVDVTYNKFIADTPCQSNDPLVDLSATTINMYLNGSQPMVWTDDYTPPTPQTEVTVKDLTSDTDFGSLVGYVNAGGTDQNFSNIYPITTSTGYSTTPSGLVTGGYTVQYIWNFPSAINLTDWTYNTTESSGSYSITAKAYNGGNQVDISNMNSSNPVSCTSVVLQYYASSAVSTMACSCKEMTIKYLQ